MSDWGKIVLYYDFEPEVPYRFLRNEPTRVRGLISKAYCGQGMLSLLYRGMNGFEYFLGNIKDKYSTFDGKKSFIDRVSGAKWDDLNVSFDVDFDHREIDLGTDCVSPVIKKVMAIAADNSAAFDEKRLSDELFMCEGTDGFLYMSYTGDPQNGYTAKYGFICGYAGESKEVMDARTAARIYSERSLNISKQETEELLTDPLFDAYESKFVMFGSTEELWQVENTAMTWIKDLFAAAKAKTERQN